VFLSPSCVSFPATMNVAALLQDAPSDDHRRRQQQRDQQHQRQHQPSPERDRLPPPPNSQSQPLPPPPPPPPPPPSATTTARHPQHSPPPAYYHQQVSRHSRAPSSPRAYAQEPAGHGQSQRLPPPSAIVGMGDPYEARHRRPDAEPLSVHHEPVARGLHGPPSSSHGPSGEYRFYVLYHFYCYPSVARPRGGTGSKRIHTGCLLVGLSPKCFVILVFRRIRPVLLIWASLTGHYYF
jgi:hypothetical protein